VHTLTNAKARVRIHQRAPYKAIACN
jgi:hypothetical protein